MKNYLFYLFAICLLFFSACGTDPMNVDVSNVQVPDITINRLEQDVFKMDTSNISASTKLLESKYGHFYTSFITGIINNGGLRDSSYNFRMKQFISDKDMREAYENCQKIYPTTDTLKEQITEIFKHFKHYFPDKNLPKVITMMSGFNYSVVMLDSTIGIGLEMYLGSKNKFYEMLTMPKYKSMFMNKENIPSDVVRAWMANEFPYNMNKSDFLNEIVYYGKIMYLTDALLPKTSDTLKIQYTQKQLEYCKQNEFNMWSYFAAQKLLYTTDQSEIMKFTSEGPFTTAFSKDSPPRVGYWIGWQIVKQYMKNNPDVSLEQLMNETDGQKLLGKAKYKPGK